MQACAMPLALQLVALLSTASAALVPRRMVLEGAAHAMTNLGEKMLHVDTLATHQWHCLPGWNWLKP
jgi:hypothetical protein